MADRDLARLRATFADPALAWIFERLRRRLRQGRGLGGTITLSRPTRAERAALDRLLGRRPTRGASLSLKLEELERILRHAGLADDLTTAAEALVGPVVDERARRARLDRQWDALFAEFAGRDSRPEVEAWFAERRTRLLARRFSSQDPALGRDLLERAFAVLTWLPAPGLPLAELAARTTGDSHALDAGQPLGTLVISAAALLGRIPDWRDADARRDVWAAVGVLLDELSAPVLVLNLRGERTSLCGELLHLHAEAGEPCRLSTRALLRHPLSLPRSGLGRVFVCENPAVVAAAASRLGRQSAPLVSIEGHEKTAARVLLRQLAEAGAELVYHGDFDWGGIRVANTVVRRHGVLPWRFTTEDYLAAVPGKELEGRPVAALWDDRLEGAMRERGRVVHEEQLLDDLLADLAGR